MTSAHRRPGPLRRSRGRVAAASVLIAALLPGAAAAQTPLAGCDEEGDSSRCRAVAVGLHTARAALGLAASGGGDLAATNSTLGKRIGSTPRVALGLRGTLVRAPLAELDGTSYTRDGTGWVRGVRAVAAAGLFDGFSAAPTVGGILSVDLLADLSLVDGSGDDGFGDALFGWGVGVRVGAFRESFTLPGVTFTATRRWLGETRYGHFADADFDDPDNRGAEFETTVTSVRGVVGKDLFAFGFLAGAGWERYEGDARVVSPSDGVVIPGGSPPPLVASADGLDADRMLFFGSVSYNFLVLQVAAEGGWAEGLGEGLRREAYGGADAVPDRDDLADLGRATWWGSLSIRLVL